MLTCLSQELRYHGARFHAVHWHLHVVIHCAGCSVKVDDAVLVLLHKAEDSTVTDAPISCVLCEKWGFRQDPPDPQPALRRISSSHQVQSLIRTNPASPYA